MLIIALNFALLSVCEARDLDVGMRGDDVRQWQVFLIRHRFLAGRANGTFGDGTRQATMKFQQSSNLPRTGIVEHETRKQAKVAPMPRSPHVRTTPASTPVPVHAIQTPRLPRNYGFSIPSPYHRTFSRSIAAFSARVKATSDEEELRQIIGAANVRHDAVVQAMQALSEKSPKLTNAAAALEFLAQGAESKSASRRDPQQKFSYGNLLQQALTFAASAQVATY